MPRTPTHPPVPRINPAVVREAFRKPSESESGYYVLEKGKTLVCLRVRKTTVHIGVRHQSRWHPVASLRAEMSVQEVEDLRMAAIHLARQFQDGEGIPALARDRSMMLAQLHKEFMADLRETRGDPLSARTLENYDDVWRLYLPTLGHLTPPRLTVEIVRQMKRDIPALVMKQRPEASSGGRYMANAALQQLYAALDFAYRMEWVSRNVASSRLVPRYEKRRSEEFLDAEGYAAAGHVLRDLEARLAQGGAAPLSQRTLLALRVAIYTGIRHRSELLWTRLEWCRLHDAVPRIGIPRAKGDRGSQGGGRWIFLGPDAVRCLKAITRPSRL